MTSVWRDTMGGREWWLWTCPSCEKDVAVEVDLPRRDVRELEEEELKACPACDEPTSLDVEQVSRPL